MALALAFVVAKCLLTIVPKLPPQRSPVPSPATGGNDSSRYGAVPSHEPDTSTEVFGGEEEEEEEVSLYWIALCYAGGAIVGGGWLMAAYFGPHGLITGVNDTLVIGVAVAAGACISVPSFAMLSIVMWMLFAYDYLMTIAVSGSLLSACHTEMCGALDVIEQYRLPMALRFWNGSALGLGDLVVGAVAVSFGMQRYGYAAGIAVVAYVAGLYLSMYWSQTRQKPVPALVPIVPLVWIVLASLHIWHTYCAAAPAKGETANETSLATDGEMESLVENTETRKSQ